MRIADRPWLKVVLGCLALVLGLSRETFAQPKQDWRVLALRVSFPKETPDNPTTTGDGTFDLRREADPKDYAGYTHPYDIPPHDHQYFEWHLEALSTYYDRVSEGRLHITWDVYPKGTDASYVVDREMVEYGRERSPDAQNRKLCELFRDGVERADSQEAVLDFGGYDCVLLFHAGVGRETGEPNDIPSAYLLAEDLDTHLGGPVSVDEGAHQISQGIILPEAAGFEGTRGLNGLVAKFFGFRLGLPGFSNFVEGLPAVGGWSLMDTGDANYGAGTAGFIPCHPMMWSKIELGWVTPVVVLHDTTLHIAASDLHGATHPKGVKIPIGGDEYYLLENRQARHEGEGFPEARFSIGDTAGVCLSAEQYDAFVPGSGILIWHVNEAVIREKRATGAVNNDFAHRGVYLEEADGYRDIGNPDLSFERGGEINGSATDPFYMGEAHADTFRDAHAGVVVAVRSAPQDVMEVEVRFERSVAGWPLRADACFTDNSPSLCADGLRVLAISDDGRLFAWDAEGPSADTSGAGGMALRDGDVWAAYGDLNLDGEQDTVWARGDTLRINGQAYGLGEKVTTAPVLGDVDHDGYLEIVLCGSGTVHAYRFNGIEAAGFPAVLSGRDQIGAIASAPVLADLDLDGVLEIVLGTESQGVHAVNGRGARVGEFPLAALGAVRTSPLFCDLDGNGALELFALTDNGYVHRWDLGRLSLDAGMEQVVWGEFGQDAHNTHTFPAALEAETPYGPKDRVLFAGRAYCYPNPVAGDEATIRFYLGRAAPVHLEMYTQVGELVDALDAAGTAAQSENEVRWNTRGLASGLYLCRIEAAQEVVWVKVALVK